MKSVLELIGLSKKYKTDFAIRDITLNVAPGEIVSIVGPNGAGKTTLLECVCGLKKPSSGTISIFGEGSVQENRALKERIGIQLQETRLNSKSTVREYLRFFSSIYKKSVSTDEIIETFGFQKYLDHLIGGLSGGWRQRLTLALAIINDPEFLILDEPTVGLDPVARRELWEIIGKLRDGKRAIVLSTHYMDEVEAMSDKVALISHGQLIVNDKPENLLRSLNLQKGSLENAYLHLTKVRKTAEA